MTKKLFLGKSILLERVIVVGIFSTLGKVVIAAAKSIDKIDDVSDIANFVPGKIDQVKDLARKAGDTLKQHEINQNNKLREQIDELSEQLGKMNAVSEGEEYESTVKVIDEKKLSIVYAIPPQYNDMQHIGNNLFSVSLNGKWGVIDINSQIIIPFEYDYIYAYGFDGNDEFVFPVKRNGKWGYINLKNEVIFDFIYERARNFQKGLAPVAVLAEDKDDWLYGYIDVSGKFVLSPKYDSAESFNNHDCATIGMYDKKHGQMQYGVINITGAAVVNCRYDDIRYEKDYIIGLNNIYNDDFYDYRGVPITPSEEMKTLAEEIKSEKDMLRQSRLYRSNKDVKNKIIPYFNKELIYGYFIQTDEESFCKIEPIFEDAYYPNAFGYARVKYNGLYGVIDLNE